MSDPTSNHSIIIGYYEGRHGLCWQDIEIEVIVYDGSMMVVGVASVAKEGLFWGR